MPPPKIQPRLSSTPQIRCMYWCRFHEDAELPEFWKERPVISITPNTHLYGAVTVIPCSTQPQTGNKWGFKLSQSFGGHENWAICDKITTLAVSRLSMDRGGVLRLSNEEFNALLTLVHTYLPQPR